MESRARPEHGELQRLGAYAVAGCVFGAPCDSSKSCRTHFGLSMDGAGAQCPPVERKASLISEAETHKPTREPDVHGGPQCSARTKRRAENLTSTKPPFITYLLSSLLAPGVPIIISFSRQASFFIVLQFHVCVCARTQDRCDQRHPRSCYYKEDCT